MQHLLKQFQINLKDVRTALSEEGSNNRIKETEDFLQLVKSLRGNLAKRILETLDMPSLFQELISLINKITL
jgi:hypothetical protein